MTLLASKELSVRQIFAESARLWKKVLGSTQLLALLLTLWISAPNFFFPEFSRHDLAWLKLIPHNIGWVVGYFIGVMILFAALYSRVNSALLEQNNSLDHALLVGIKKILFMLVATVIIGLLLAAGFALLLIPGIILWVVLIFYYPVIVVEDLNPLAALKRCWQSVWPHWWRTAAVLLIPNILFAALCTVAEIFGTDIYKIAHPLGGELWLFRHTIKLIICALYSPFFATLVLVQWNDLQLRRAE